MSELFRGVGVALVTLFREDGALDAEATGKLAAQLAGRGMQAILVAGTTGEASALTEDERRTLTGAVRAAVPENVPVLAGTGATSARQATALTRDAVSAGADAVLAWPPPGGRDLAGYFAAVAGAASGRPVLAYHFPAVYPPGVPVGELAALPVAGVKDSSGDVDRLLEELAHYQGATYAGSSGVLAMAGPLGATGALLALANTEPEQCIAAFNGDPAAQLALADAHLAVKRDTAGELKRTLAREHRFSPVVRIG